MMSCHRQPMSTAGRALRRSRERPTRAGRFPNERRLPQQLGRSRHRAVTNQGTAEPMDAAYVIHFHHCFRIAPACPYYIAFGLLNLQPHFYRPYKTTESVPWPTPKSHLNLPMPFNPIRVLNPALRSTISAPRVLSSRHFHTTIPRMTVHAITR
jgi:hypothetical protein